MTTGKKVQFTLNYRCFVYPCASVYGLHIIVIVILYRLSFSILVVETLLRDLKFEIFLKNGAKRGTGN